MKKKNMALFITGGLLLSALYASSTAFSESNNSNSINYNALLQSEQLSNPHFQIDPIYVTDTSVSGTTVENSEISIVLTFDDRYLLGKGYSDSNGNFSIPLASPLSTAYKLKFIATSNNQTITTEVPVLPLAISKVVVDEISDSDTIISGKASKKSLVSVMKENELIAYGFADSSGEFSVEMPESQQVGTELKVYSENENGKGPVTTVTIEKEGLPSAPMIDPIYDMTTVVTGTGKIGNTITIKSGNMNLGTTVVGSNGTFECPIGMVSLGDLIQVYSQNSNGISEPVNVEVLMGHPYLTVSPFDNYSTHISGLTSENTTISIKKADVVIAEGKTTADNKNFSISIPNQDLDTELTITATNNKGLETSKTIKVSAIPSGILYLNDVAENECIISGIASMGSTISVLSNNSVLATEKTILNTSQTGQVFLTEGTFSIKLPELKKGEELTIIAKNDFGESNPVLGTQKIVVQ